MSSPSPNHLPSNGLTCPEPFNAGTPDSDEQYMADRGLRAAVLDQAVFDPTDPDVKQDIIRLIIQYLQDEGYNGSSMVVQDETNVKVKAAANKRSQLKRMKRAILDGDWPEVERLLARATFKNHKAFRYAVHRQQFLELIEERESQKAFVILQSRLKELEAYAYTADEFRDLCYLLTCKSVPEAASFRDWDGVGAARADLVDQYSRLLEFDAFQRDGQIPMRVRQAQNGQVHAKDVPPGRLLHLLQQSLAFQIGSSRHKPKAPPRIGTILEDYECVVIPNRKKLDFKGHTGNVKCVTFVGEEGCTLASGSSDNTIRMWDTATGRCKTVLRGHRSRVWDISASRNGMLMASGSGDGTIRMWDTSRVLDLRPGLYWPSREELDFVDMHSMHTAPPRIAPFFSNSGHVLDWADTGVVANGAAAVESRSGEAVCRAVLHGHSNDVYTVRFHPRGNALVSGGYDRCLRLFDMETQTMLKAFNGHKSSISSIAFNARGNMIITGSKDSTIRYWDILSGICIKTISSHLGEVTSVETNQAGTLLLSSSKDNANRLWDIRMNRAIRRFKGHQNTSKNFIRVGFGTLESMVIGGSEDGFVYIWDLERTDVVSKLGPASGPVYGVKWNGRQALLASGSDDGIVSTWGFDGKPESEMRADG